MSVPKIVEITYNTQYIRDFPRDDCARNLSEENSTTRQRLICAEILPSHYSLPVPQRSNLA